MSAAEDLHFHGLENNVYGSHWAVAGSPVDFVDAHSVDLVDRAPRA